MKLAKGQNTGFKIFDCKKDLYDTEKIKFNAEELKGYLDKMEAIKI